MFKLSHAITKGLLAKSKCSFLKLILLWLRWLLVLHYRACDRSLAFCYRAQFSNPFSFLILTYLSFFPILIPLNFSFTQDKTKT